MAAATPWWIWIILALIFIVGFKFAKRVLKFVLFIAVLVFLVTGIYYAVPALLSNPTITGFATADSDTDTGDVLSDLTEDEVLEILSSRNAYTTFAKIIQEKEDLPITARPVIVAQLRERYEDENDLKRAVLYK